LQPGAYEQRYKVTFLADGGGIVTDSTPTLFLGPIGVWTKFTLNGLVVPANATSAFIQIFGVTGTTAGDAGEVLIDDVSLSGPGFGPPTLFASTTAPAVGISWRSTTGKSVRVQSSLSLSSWANFGAVVPGDNTIKTAFDAIVDPKKFYRVGELP
jgi:hypothetical protein